MMLHNCKNAIHKKCKSKSVSNSSPNERSTLDGNNIVDGLPNANQRDDFSDHFGHTNSTLDRSSIFKVPSNKNVTNGDNPDCGQSEIQDLDVDNLNFLNTIDPQMGNEVSRQTSGYKNANVIAFEKCFLD